MDTETRQALEAILFVVDEPIEAGALAELLERPREAVEADLAELAAAYEAEERGLAIRRAAGGWRMYTAEAAYPYVERYALAGRSGRLTQAALETLAVVAYKQPITRQEISDVRGVNADGAVRSLVQRGFLAEVGRDDGPGQAIRYGTTPLFLERLGLQRVDELPPLTDFLPEAPAPDEPGPDLLRAARQHLAGGGELPSTGRPRWDPLGDRDTNTVTATGSSTGGSVAVDDPDDDVLPPVEARPAAGADDDEMDELAESLERAARSAMAQLRQAIAATEEDDGDADGDDDGGDRTGGD